MKIYVASSWKNYRHPDVIHSLRNAGNVVYDFRNPELNVPGFKWDHVDPNWKSWSEKDYLGILSNPVVEAGYQRDLKELISADACVLLLPAGRSAHIEAGYCVGAKIPTLILLGGELEADLMYKMATGIFTDLGKLIERLNEIEATLPRVA